jgi:PPM family protein phosphatase
VGGGYVAVMEGPDFSGQNSRDVPPNSIVPPHPKSPAPGRFETEGRTHIGNVRERNEDTWGACRHSGVLFVADGLGGQGAGDVASRIAGGCVMDITAALREGDRALATQLFVDTAARAGRLMQLYVGEHPDAVGLATTLTVVWLYEPRRAHVFHIGDSRAYLLRDGQLAPVTADHSAVHELVARGELTREQGRANRFAHLVTRCIGRHGATGGPPDIFDVDIQPGDVLLVTSDGLTDMVPERHLEAMCKGAPDLSHMLYEMERAALGAGGRDNITAVAIRVPAGAW